MLIQRAVIEDLEDILNLQKIAFQSEAEIYNDYTIPPLTQTLDEIKQEFSYHHFLKAVLNNTIIGSVRAYESEGTCYIRRLVVHPEFQNQGIGTRLMYAIEDSFSNTKRFELYTGHKSLKNQYLYKKLGYSQFKIEVIKNGLKYVYMEKIKRG